MGRIYRRGNTWHAYWTDAAGESHRESLRTRDRDVARKRLRALELGAPDSAEDSAHTLRDALQGLERAMAGRPAGTLECYEEKSLHLLRIFGADARLSSVTRDRSLAYISTRLSDGASSSTVAKECVVLRRALAEAAARKLWSGDPRSVVPQVKVHYEPKERWLTRPEAAGLLAVLPPERALWTAIGIYAGLRHSEIERLRWEHVDLARGILRAPGRKTKGAWRRIPIAAELARMLAEHGDGTGLVVRRWPNVRRDLQVAMTTVIEGAPRRRRPGKQQPREVPPQARISPNDLRRTFASWLVQAGVPHLVVAHLLGHSTTRMVELVYGRLSEDTYRDAIDALNAHCAAGVQPNSPIRAAEAVQANGSTDKIPNRSVQVLVPRDGVEPPTRGFSVRWAGRLKAVK